ncbi:MAG TPA: GxxExxY protein [Ignavibacteria bacterium]|nr:GxxExxY protein [Ignavibacteria bacterium]
MTILHKDITDKVLRSFYNVYNTLGYGFLEKVYENSMMIELNELGLHCERQKQIKVFYKEKEVGEYYADILVENKVILELKACEVLMPEHQAQLLNYLKATEIEVGLLLNFGQKPEFKRMILENKLKPKNK